MRLGRICSRQIRITSQLMNMTQSTAPKTVVENTRPKAYVRSLPTEDKLTVSLILAGKQRNLNRPKDEPLEKPLSRIKASIMPKPDKRAKRGKGGKQQVPAEESMSEEGDVFVGLYADEDTTQLLDVSTPNGAAWLQAKALRVGDTVFDVELNPPTVDRIVVHSRPMVGFPLTPFVALSFAERQHCQWRWSRMRKGQGSAGHWEDLRCPFPVFIPSEEDVGFMLRAECTPGARAAPVAPPAAGATRGGVGAGGAVAGGDVSVPHTPHAPGELVQGEPVSSADIGPVEEAPAQTAAELRCGPAGRLPRKGSPGFRVLTYNVLADQYAASDYARKVLFKYCPPRQLEVEYRQALVLQELLAYDADVLCLQEVDEKVFFEYLTPHLELHGYAGFYSGKEGKVREGSATFHRLSRFQAVTQRSVSLRDVFREPLSPPHDAFAPLLSGYPELAHALQRVGTIGQVSLLAPCDGAPLEDGALLVVNTHLFFHPFAPHIRSMHAAALLWEAAAFAAAAAADGAAGAAALLMGRRVAPLFCGDLNSDLNDGVPGVVQLLQSGSLPADFWDWRYLSVFSWGKGEEEFTEAEDVPPPGEQAGAAAAGGVDSPARGVEVRSPFLLRSADGLGTPYSNYTSGYKALLDYCWHDQHALACTRQLPVPSEEQLASFIPSAVFPSDHLAMVFDLAWQRHAA